jgi:cyclin C
MSANFWESTQRRHWQFSKDQLASMRQKLEDDNAELVRMYPLPQPRHLSIYFNSREQSRLRSANSLARH